MDAFSASRDWNAVAGSVAKHASEERRRPAVPRWSAKVEVFQIERHTKAEINLGQNGVQVGEHTVEYLIPRRPGTRTSAPHVKTKGGSNALVDAPNVKLLFQAIKHLAAQPSASNAVVLPLELAPLSRDEPSQDGEVDRHELFAFRDGIDRGASPNSFH